VGDFAEAGAAEAEEMIGLPVPGTLPFCRRTLKKVAGRYACLDLIIALVVARDLLVDGRVHKVYRYALPLLIVGQGLAVYILAAQSFLVAGDLPCDSGMMTAGINKGR
jgi:hypothetical protein